MAVVHELASDGDWRPWAFDRAALVALGRARHGAYLAARPYPHVVIDGFLGEAHAGAIARGFPPPEHPGWKRRDHAEQARFGQLVRAGVESVALRWLLAELTGSAFVEFLGAVAGRRDLIADPHYLGAGPMIAIRGGHLALHADFNRDSARRLDRVLTALYYAPLAWDAAWGGELELWNADRSACEARIAPMPDRLVVLAHGDAYWHGHPTPLACPDGVMRAVVAAYYYAAPIVDGDDDRAHGAIWAR